LVLFKEIVEENSINKPKHGVSSGFSFAELSALGGSVQVPGSKTSSKIIYSQKIVEVPKHKTIGVSSRNQALFKRKYYTCNILKQNLFV